MNERYCTIASTPFACTLYGKVGHKLKGSIAVKNYHVVAWRKESRTQGANAIGCESDNTAVVPDAAIFILDRSDKSDITNCETTFSIECTPVREGSATITATYGNAKVPVTFFIHAEGAE